MTKISTLLSILFFVLGSSGCYPEKGKRIRKINELEEMLLDQAKQKEVNQNGINRLLEDYARFAADFPSDSLAPEYLYKRAQFLQYMRFFEESIDGYRMITSVYPDYRHTPFCMFVQGFLFDSELQSYDSARVRYTAFLEKYPKHPLAKDVKLLLVQLGKTPDELVEGFQKMNAETDSIPAQ